MVGISSILTEAGLTHDGHPCILRDFLQLVREHSRRVVVVAVQGSHQPIKNSFSKSDSRFENLFLLTVLVIFQHYLFAW